jgi:phage terminase Nu1 subunit (DNA packaging protein)
MTITIEVKEQLVSRIGVEIAEIVDLMDSIGEDLKMLDRRIGAIDGLHDDLVDAENQYKAQNTDSVDLSEVYEAEEHLANMKKKYGLP